MYLMPLRQYLDAILFPNLITCHIHMNQYSLTYREIYLLFKYSGNIQVNLTRTENQTNTGMSVRAYPQSRSSSRLEAFHSDPFKGKEFIK